MFIWGLKTQSNFGLAILLLATFSSPRFSFAGSAKNPCGTVDDLSTSIYYTPDQKEFEKSGKKNFAEAVRMEGAGINADGKVVNKDNQVDKDMGCQIPQGLGGGSGRDQSARGSAGCMIPFFTIAADLSKTAYQAGDIIFIKAVKDAHIKLPNGKEHPGYFIVQDTGDAFKGAGAGRFDIFTGKYAPDDPNNPMVKALPWLDDKKSCAQAKGDHKFQLLNEGAAGYQDGMTQIESAVGGAPPMRLAQGAKSQR